MPAIASIVMIVLIVASGLIGLAQGLQPRSGTHWVLAKRSTFAISYAENEYSAGIMIGALLDTKVTGRIEGRRRDGQTQVRIWLENLPHPQILGANYTSYVIWAIPLEGQAENMGRLSISPARKAEVEITTPHQLFGLIVTAEPHPMVKYPGPMIVAENLLDRLELGKGVKGGPAQSIIEYRGDPGIFYAVAGQPAAASTADYETPLSILGARRAVEIARRAGAKQYAAGELRQAEDRLAVLERIWPQYLRNNGKGEEIRDTAFEVMRLAEEARAASVKHSEGILTESEAAAAKLEAERIRTRSIDSQEKGGDYRTAIARYETALAQALQRAEQAPTRAERVEAREAIVQLETERAQIEQSLRESDEALQQLQSSISEIAGTRREARGLIIGLPDRFFDPAQATLTTEARELLNRLTNALLAYPGSYRIGIEGHTDPAGADTDNRKRSEGLAASVRDHMVQAGLPADRIATSDGLSQNLPASRNGSVEGGTNRLVEIVITDVEARITSQR